ncbi:MAG: DNA alkylation repair protein [Candidatus Lokiarchaeota archaeon]|nr:DNA alkylation repair protein [Candidatus Lokiarchaeota archaeon]
MTEKDQDNPEITKIMDFVKDGRIDDAVNIIALYLGDATQDDYLNRLEDIIEMLLSLHGGRIVLRFLIERLIIDIPSLLENLSKRDSVLRYSFLLLLKTSCENECDLFLPHSEDLLNSDDPNVREAILQLIIFVAEGEAAVEDESLINKIALSLADEKEFVVKKAIQALISIGKKHPLWVTKAVTNHAKNNPENEELKNAVDSVLKSIVTVEKIDEIVEEAPSEGEMIEKQEIEIIDKELELKKKEIEIKKKKIELEEKEKKLEEKIIQEKEKSLKLKEEILEQETVVPAEADLIPKKVKKQLKKEESEIIDKEIELKKKDLEIKKKKLDLEIKEREIEEMAIEEKEKALKIKEEIIEKETELSQAEIELRQKIMKEKEQKMIETEIRRSIEEFKELEDQSKDEDDKNVSE